MAAEALLAKLLTAVHCTTIPRGLSHNIHYAIGRRRLSRYRLVKLSKAILRQSVPLRRVSSTLTSAMYGQAVARRTLVGRVGPAAGW